MANLPRSCRGRKTSGTRRALLLDSLLGRLLALVTRHGEARVFVLALLVSEAITAVLVVPASIYFRGEVTAEYFVVGAVTCGITASIVCSVLFGLVRRLRTAEAERERLHAQLLASQRLEALGKLAGGIAHDFNNILGGVLGNVSFLKDLAGGGDDRAPPTLTDPDVREVLGDIDGACRRAADLTRQLVAFARAEPPVISVVDLGELVEEVGRLFRRTAGRSVEVVVDLPATGLCAEVDPSQLHQVVLNLCVNARDALAGAGTIRLSVSRVDETWLAIRVEDDGAGMDEATRQQACEPFFTTKGSGGSGLGLSVVHGVVSRHGGRVEIDSTPGAGTRVTVHLRASAACPETRPEEAPASPSRGTVLVVDDEPAMRAAIARMASRVGWRALTAADSATAMGVMEAQSTAVDCVMLDMVMPGTGGLETFRRLRAAHPRLRVIAMSGHDVRGDGATLLAEGGATYLRKPFGLHELAMALDHQPRPGEGTSPASH